jgi:hypothetical protein
VEREPCHREDRSDAAIQFVHNGREIAASLRSQQ